jgi:hypothetical protein
MIFKDNAENFEPMPTGLQQAILVNVFDIGYQMNNLDGLPVHQCVFLWELDKRKKDGTRFTVTKRYTASLNDRANLRRDLVSWRGKEFTPEQIKGFDSNNLIGLNCTLNLVEKTTKKGRPYVDVATVMNMRKGDEKLTAEMARDYMPEWIKKAIAAQVNVDQGKAASVSSGAGVPSDDDFDDDIPF